MIVLFFILPMVMIMFGVYFIIRNRIALQREIGIAWLIGGIINVIVSIVILRNAQTQEQIFSCFIFQTLIFLLSILPVQIRFIRKRK